MEDLGTRLTLMNMSRIRRNVAVIGAGWAGCAAAVELARRGCEVHLYEAARIAGGRARRIDLHGQALDNGQHILLGAYRDTLHVMHLVGLEPASLLLRLPLRPSWTATKLASLRRSACRSATLPPAPKRRSKTTRGCASAGRGAVGVAQDRLFW